MDFEPHIVVTTKHTFAGVYPYTHTNRALRGPGVLGQRALYLSSGLDGVTSANKDKKEAVSPLSYLDPSGFGYCLAN